MIDNAVFNKFPSTAKEATFPLLLRIFSRQLSLPSSLRLAVQIHQGRENFFVFH